MLMCIVLRQRELEMVSSDQGETRDFRRSEVTYPRSPSRQAPQVSRGIFLAILTLPVTACAFHINFCITCISLNGKTSVHRSDANPSIAFWSSVVVAGLTFFFMAWAACNAFRPPLGAATDSKSERNDLGQWISRKTRLVSSSNRSRFSRRCVDIYANGTDMSVAILECSISSKQSVENRDPSLIGFACKNVVRSSPNATQMLE